MYQRVIPRDLFNESNLLKCMGRIYILLETTDCSNVELTHDDEAFDIEQNQYTGGIYVRNVRLMVRGKHVHLERPLNSRGAWPLYATMEDDDEISVFDDDGNFTQEMLAYLAGQKL